MIAWWSRTPSMGGLGYLGMLVVGVGMGVGAVPHLVAFFVGLLIAGFGVQMVRADVTKRTTRVMFAMVSPQFPGAVMVVDAERVSPVCQAPDCVDIPPHPVHFQEGS